MSHDLHVLIALQIVKAIRNQVGLKKTVKIHEQINAGICDSPEFGLPPNNDAREWMRNRAVDARNKQRAPRKLFDTITGKRVMLKKFVDRPNPLSLKINKRATGLRVVLH